MSQYEYDKKSVTIYHLRLLWNDKKPLNSLLRFSHVATLLKNTLPSHKKKNQHIKILKEKSKK